MAFGLAHPDAPRTVITELRNGRPSPYGEGLFFISGFQDALSPRAYRPLFLGSGVAEGAQGQH